MSTTTSEPETTRLFRSITSPSSQASGTSNPSLGGNRSSTALFFLALAVGLLIALLFMFFTMRYFVRSKYGLHVYPLYHRNVLAGEGLSEESTSHMHTTNDELQDLLEYIREHHFIRGDPIERRINRGRRRRRGRYARMKKLSQEDVERLFPQKTYNDWLNGGKERDVEKRDGLLQEDGLFGQSTDKTIEFSEMHESSSSGTSHDISEPIPKSEVTEIELRHLGTEAEKDSGVEPRVEVGTELRNDLGCEQELHFSSGSCAICLEILEDDAIVRGLVCGHVFHSECLDPWLTKRRACCPMCKRDYFCKEESSSMNRANNNDNENGLDLGTGRQINQNDGNGNGNENDNDNDIVNGSDQPTPDGNETEVQPQTQTQENADDTISLQDDISIDFEAFRNDSTLRQMLQELIPPSERARMILNDNSLRHLNIDERAQQYAKRRYGRSFKRLWWIIMGIRREDIYYMEVIQISNSYRESQAGSESRESGGGTDSPAPSGPEMATSGPANTTLDSSTTTAELGSGPTLPNDAISNSDSRDLSVSRSRDAVEQRV